LGIAHLSIQNKGGSVKKIRATVHVITECKIEAVSEEEYQKAIKELKRITPYTASHGSECDWEKRKVVRIEEVMKITDTTKEPKTDER
jgi:hypothetical protein